MREIPFDDVEALAGEVSETYSPWGECVVVAQEMIDQFAELTTDRQWIHVDRQRAEAGPFGNTIAHGFLVLSLLPAVRPPSTFRVSGHAAVSNYGIQAVRFLAPVPAGEAIRARSRLVAVKEHRRGTLLTSEVAIHRVPSEQPSLSMRLQLLYLG